MTKRTKPAGVTPLFAGSHTADAVPAVTESGHVTKQAQRLAQIKALSDSTKTRLGAQCECGTCWSFGVGPASDRKRYSVGDTRVTGFPTDVRCRTCDSLRSERLDIAHTWRVEPCRTCKDLPLAK